LIIYETSKIEDIEFNFPLLINNYIFFLQNS